MLFPLQEKTYHKTSGFRPWNRPDHCGVDYAAVEGTPVYAVDDGEVYIARPEDDGAGTNLWIHAGNAYWKYFHLSEITVESNAQVKAGDVVGAVGHTGHVVPAGPGGAHLHIELHMDNPSNPVNPTDILDRCEAAANFPGKETTMTNEEWDRRAEGLRKALQYDTLAGLVAMAKVNHHYLNEAVVRMGGEPLAPFDVNSVQE